MNSSRMQKWYFFFDFLNFDAKNSGWKSLRDGGRVKRWSLDQRTFAD